MRNPECGNKNESQMSEKMSEYMEKQKKIDFLKKQKEQEKLKKIREQNEEIIKRSQKMKRVLQQYDENNKYLCLHCIPS